MRDVTADRLQISFSGSAIQDGRMSMTTLAQALRGQSLLIERVGYLIYGPATPIAVEVDETFERGSLVSPVHIVTESLQTAQTLLTSLPAIAFTNLLTILSFNGVSPASLYSLFKRFRGRPITSPGDLPPRKDLDLSVNLTVNIYNDNEVQGYLRQSLEPLRTPGIYEFQTRSNGIVINRVSKSDLAAADQAELEALNVDEEVELNIEKAAWRRSLAWHFSNEKGSFDAKIEDDDFWKRISAGESFSSGDRMRVHLQTVAEYTGKGKLRITRRIPKVISIDHVRARQSNIFPDTNI